VKDLLERQLGLKIKVKRTLSYQNLVDLREMLKELQGKTNGRKECLQRKLSLMLGLNLFLKKNKLKSKLGNNKEEKVQEKLEKLLLKQAKNLVKKAKNLKKVKDKEEVKVKNLIEKVKNKKEKKEIMAKEVSKSLLTIKVPNTIRLLHSSRCSPSSQASIFSPSS